MSSILTLKKGFVDIAAALFVIGGVISLVLTALMIPVSSIYPFRTPETISLALAIVLTLSLICSLGAIHCYSLGAKRLLSHAGIRGLIFGAILLATALGLVGVTNVANAALGAGSAILILVAGTICFVLRESARQLVPTLVIREHLPQRA